MRVAITYGTFMPLTVAKQKMLNSALYNSNTMLLAVCGNDVSDDRNFIAFDDRLQVMRRIYRQDKVLVYDMPKIRMHKDTERRFDDWEVWSDGLFRKAGIRPDSMMMDYVWYLAKYDHAEDIKAVYPRHRIVVMPECDDTMLCRAIRKHPMLHQREVNPEFIYYLREKHILR